MTIAEKLLRAKEDLDNVYDKGYEDGLANVTEPILQDKTINPTLEEQVVIADNDYDGLQTVTIGAMPAAEQATPSIAVDNTGLITATATQASGYVLAGIKSATAQLAFQPAKSITPSINSQIAVSSGYYIGGDITVDAIPSTYVQPSGTLSIATNGTHDVKNYASVDVNVANSGGDTSMEDSLVTRTGSNYTNDRVTSIGDYAFAQYYNLTSISFPKCKTIGMYAFSMCEKLITADFPICDVIGSYAFQRCSKLTTINFPTCTDVKNSAFTYCSTLSRVDLPSCSIIGNGAFTSCKSLFETNFPACKRVEAYTFQSCFSLKSLSFPVCESIQTYAFRYCSSLTTIYLSASTVCNLVNSNAFMGAGIGSNKGNIYVRPSLVSEYKAATNWAFFSARIYSYSFSDN